MTAKYDLMKAYGKGTEIAITPNSLWDFLKGKRDTLEHIVQYHHQDVVVEAKPRIPNYQHYVIQYSNKHKVRFFYPVGNTLPLY